MTGINVVFICVPLLTYLFVHQHSLSLVSGTVFSIGSKKMTKTHSHTHYHRVVLGTGVLKMLPGQTTGTFSPRLLGCWVPENEKRKGL